MRTVIDTETMASYSENWTRVVKAEGCVNRVPVDMILKWQGKYGEVMSELLEDVLKNGKISKGNNTTGIYAVMVNCLITFHNCFPLIVEG
jgi:hypothetical protein